MVPSLNKRTNGLKCQSGWTEGLAEEVLTEGKTKSKRRVCLRVCVGVRITRQERKRGSRKIRGHTEPSSL